MKHPIVVVRWLVLALGVCFAAASCFPEGSGISIGVAGAGGEQTSSGGSGATETGGDAGQAPMAMCVPHVAQDGAQCHPAQTGEPLPARSVVGVAATHTLYREDLFNTMNSYCGVCHKAPANLGGFTFSSGTFSDVIDQKVIDAIKSEVMTCPRDNAGNKVDPTCYNFMPPQELGGKKWSEREADPNDRLAPFVEQLSAWLKQGSKDTYTVTAAAGEKSAYSVSPELASAFTNLGTCVPDPGMVGTDPSTCDLDARFAAMQRNPQGSSDERLGLPLTLDATDLTSYDSAELARRGVVAYRPAYPLWTDDAGKLRYVRVPVGQSITYNKKTKQFDIPANTRFYKTFMKKVKGVDGVVRYRKVETRLIVSRPRDAEGVDQSLFGTYVWEDDESQAKLLITPQNNGEPFVDQVKTLTTDEGIALEVQALVRTHKVRNYTYEMDSRHATRRYAFPSLQRCIQCHMGSPGENFILGFTPLQVNVRACSAETIASNGHCDAGQIEPASGDEVTQLARLRSYGVISNYSDADAQKLEDPQGTSKAPRPVRSPEELVAQAYMLGNCSHCHNPNGYPSVEHPELKPLLNFLPGADGGIFGFPFERYSPRIFRNTTGDGPIAYISPSLRDRYGDTTHGWLQKVGKKASNSSDPGAAGETVFIDAPWRSLIYRNVDTPFTYVDDSAIYPHMPLNSPGFDCRAPRIMGEWMTSIPALAKHPELSEDTPTNWIASAPPLYTEVDPQPYREVKPGDQDYDNGLFQASKRLDAFRSGLRDKNYCPDTSDIVDLNVERSDGQLLIPTDLEVAGLPHDNVPDRPHWVTIDLTNPPGAWNPRRTDWKQILVQQDFSDVDHTGTGDDTAPLLADDQAALEAQKRVVSMLQSVTLPSAANDLLHTPVPFGIWQQKAGCKLDTPSTATCAKGFCGKVGDFDGRDAAHPRPRWLNISTKTPDGTPITADSPVYSALPGSLVFNMICVNCHGADADSGGRQAQTLAEMTGGTARVANFRDGLFGPVGKGGENRNAIFGSDDLAARYLPWMALGGTKVRIPQPILNLVANTPVLGVARKNISVTSANMLQTALALCRLVGQMTTNGFDPTKLNGALNQADLHSTYGELIRTNGDAELWTKLCTFNNPPPVHAVQVIGAPGAFVLVPSDLYTYFPQTYPAAPIGNGKGQIEASLSPDNDSPWCVRAVDPTASGAAAMQAWLDTQTLPTPSGGTALLPICPSDFVVPAHQYQGGKKDINDGHYIYGDIDDWSARGAINAGQSVFVYLDRMISQGKGRDLRFDECEQLGN